MSPTKMAFDRAMMDIYHRAKAETGYTPSLFLKLLADKGGVATAKQLINAASPSTGYTKLWELGRLDLTVEAMIVDNAQWHELFSDDELFRAKSRLKSYGYEFD